MAASAPPRLSAIRAYYRGAVGGKRDGKGIATRNVAHLFGIYDRHIEPQQMVSMTRFCFFRATSWLAACAVHRGYRRLNFSRKKRGG